MNMPGRKYDNGSEYRYGFNGKENDKDAGEGIQDYGMRIYDARLGRFLSEDPITSKYPMLTPYQFASNRPMDGIDFDGLEWSSIESIDPNNGGKTTVSYTIKISLADSRNQIKTDNITLKGIKERTEAIMSNTTATGTKADPIVKVNIEFTDDPGAFVVSFHDFNTYSDYDPVTKKAKVSGDPYVYGVTREYSNSQDNKIDVALSNKFRATEKGIPGGTTMNSEKYSTEIISRTLGHELGHTVGLFHPWSELNDIPQIDNKRALPPENNKGLIINNLLNSEGNPIKELRTNSGTELIPQQRAKIKETVETQQPQIRRGKI